LPQIEPELLLVDDEDIRNPNSRTKEAGLVRKSRCHRALEI